LGLTWVAKPDTRAAHWPMTDVNIGGIASTILAPIARHDQFAPSHLAAGAHRLYIYS